jgi:hypothetical protein
MQKFTTLSNKTDLFKTKRAENAPELQPKQETLNRILQFAAAYRVQKSSENQYIELFLN